MLDGLVLAIRALRWRAAVSLAVLLVAVLASGAATLGPLYSRSAQDSLVLDRVAGTSTFTRSVAVTAELGAQPARAGQTLSAAQRAAADPRLDRFFGPAQESLDTSTSFAIRVAGHQRGTAVVAWRSSMCTSVRFSVGRCPRDGTEVAVSTTTATGLRLRPGSPIDVGLTLPAASRGATVVGVYDAVTATGPAFAVSSPAQSTAENPAAAPDAQPPSLDLVLASRALLLGNLPDSGVTIYRTLRPGSVHVGDLAALTGVLGGVTRNVDLPDQPQYSVSSGMSGLVTALAGERATVQRSALVVTAQLVLLSWFVLYLLVAATTEERAPEVAVAKLRGMGPRAVGRFVLAEPVVLLVLAAPLGLLLGLAADTALVRAGLDRQAQVRLDTPTGVAMVAAALGGLVACALAARRVLTVPVLAEMRRTGGRRARVARTVAVDAVIVTVAVVGVLQARGNRSDTLVLLVPALLAVAVGVPVARLVPVLAALEVRRTRRSPRIGAFLAARNLARRPTGSRLVVLLAVAVALAVFAVDGWDVAAGTRANVARQQVGAASVLHVAYEPGPRLVEQVRAADPDGRSAMAAVQSAGGSTGALLAVDSARLGPVTAWDPAWARTSMSALTAALHPAAAPPVQLVGPAVTVRTRYTPPGRGPGIAWGLSLRVLGYDGTVSDVGLGTVGVGTSQLRARLPGDCLRRPCGVLRVTLGRPVTGGAADGLPAQGTVELAGMADSTGHRPPPSAGPPGTARWRVARSALGVVDAQRPPDAVLAAGSDPSWFVAALGGGTAGDVGVESTAFPSTVPVLAGSDAPANSYAAVPGAVYASGLGYGQLIVSPVDGRGVLPRVGTTGSMADMTVLATQDSARGSDVDSQVWVAAGAPADLVTRLRDQGVRVLSTETLNARRAELGRDGVALSLRVLLVAAVAGLLLAATAVLTASLVAARRRSWELAAVRVLGARPRDLVTAGRREQLVLVVVGTALGTLAGLAGLGAVLSDLAAVPGGGAPLTAATFQWLPIASAVAATLLGTAVAVQLGAWRTVRLADLGLLREVQP